MNQLPLCLEKIILDYKYQLELTEHQEKMKPTMELMKEKIIEYMNPEDMKNMWGGRTMFHGELTSNKTPRNKIRWCRDMCYRNYDTDFDKCRHRLECSDCGLNIPYNSYDNYGELYPRAVGCYEYECDKWFCGCEGRTECECENED